MQIFKTFIQNEIVRKYFGNLLLLCVAILVSLLIVEGILRVVYKQHGLQDHINFYKHSCHSVTRPPNISDRFINKQYNTNVLFETNNLGFRDVNHDIEKKEGTYRIVFVGDSMVEGTSVEFQERSDQLVQNILRSKGVDVEVITFAISGIGPMVYAQILECIGYRYNPDLIVVNFFPLNDFMDFTWIDEETYKNNFYTPGEIVHQPDDKNAFFMKVNIALFNDKKSRFLLFLQNLYDRIKLKNDSKVGIPNIYDIYFGVNTDEHAESVWESNRKIFEVMFTQANKRDVDMLWVNLAMTGLVKTAESPFFIAGKKYEKDVRSYPIDREIALAKEFDVHYIYLYEALHEGFLEHGGGLYSDGTHFSSRGHAVVAETISDYIITNILDTENPNE